MNLRDKIREVLTETKENKLISMIKKHGIVSTSDFVGGYDRLFKLLGDYELTKKDKVEIIKNHIYRNWDGWVDLNDFGKEFTYVDNKPHYTEIAEYLGGVAIYVKQYRYSEETDSYDWENYREFHIKYEDLPDNILDHIFKLIIEHKI